MADNWAQVRGVPQVLQALTAHVEGMIGAATAAATEIAALLEAYAKTHHLWQSETGDTEASIQGEVVEASSQIVKAVVSAGMDYDVFLEMAHEGKWAWLWPAVTENEPQIRAILQKYLRNVKLDRRCTSKSYE